MEELACLYLLGTFQLVADNKTITTFRSDKVRALLAWLVVESNRSHPRQIPATLLWEDFETRSALRNLRVSLSNLKKVLTDIGLVEVLTISRNEIALAAGGLLKCDALELLSLLNEANRHDHNDGSICDDCWQKLNSAIDLYRGEFMTGLTIDDSETFYQWQLVHREHLHAEVSNALNTLMGAATQRKLPQKLRRFARRQLTLTPWDEVAHRALIQSHIDEGKQAQALAQFENCRQVLWDELGIEPSEETVALHAQIGKSTHAVQPLSQPQVVSNLPRLQLVFFGRKSQRLRITDLIRDPTYPLVTIVGNGGIGKTQLAMTIGADLLPEMADGVWFVPLNRISAGDDESVKNAVVNAICQALNLDLERTNNQFNDLCAWLKNRRLLIILDNLEHLQHSAVVPQLVQSLLEEANQLTILATSRRPLNLRIERIERLGGLPVPKSAESAAGRSSIELFAERAQRASNYQLKKDDLDAIILICHLVEGSPLAIELAAGWTTHMSPNAIAIALQHDISSLQTKLVDVPERHRSLKSVFNYSWDLLSKEEQRVLAIISVFQGAFSLPAAENIAQTNGQMLDGLADRSLLWTSAENNTYTVPTIIRRFAHSKLELALASLHQQTVEAHAIYFIEQLIEHTGRLQYQSDTQISHQLAEQFPDLEQAWLWCIHNQRWQLLDAALLPFFHLCDTRSLYRPGADVLQQLIVAPNATTASESLLTTRATARLGWFQFQLGDVENGRAKLQETLVVFEQHSALAEAVFSQNYLAAISMHGGDYELALQHVQKALSISAESRDQLGQMIALNLRGRIAWLTGDESANDFFRNSLGIARQLKHDWSSSFSLEYLGEVAFSQQKYSAAERLYLESLAIREKLEDPRGSSLCTIKLADIALAQSDPQKAASLYQSALTKLEQIGNLLGTVTCLERLGSLALVRDDLVTARRYLLRAVHMGQIAPPTMRAIDGMARVLRAEDDMEQALGLWGWLVNQALTPPDLRDAIGKQLETLQLSAEIFPASTQKYHDQTIQQVTAAIY